MARGLALADDSLADVMLKHEVAVDPRFGGATATVEIPVTPGRSDFWPRLTLNYTSSSVNSAYGIGWSLSGVPAIVRGGDRQLPQYDRTDRFYFAGEEIVPWQQRVGGKWVPRAEQRGEFRVEYYRQRFGAIGMRFELWTHDVTRRMHWCVRDQSNVVSVFGLRADHASRIADPADENRVQAWLLELRYDELGNAIRYEYLPEDSANVDRSASWERRRVTTAQRYIKRIRYANSKPVSRAGVEPAGTRYHLEVVFDYGDHGLNPTPASSRVWPVRVDPCSTFRAGFEVRTFRLCRRILMFHDFDELGPDATLVGELKLEHDEHPTGTTVRAMRYIGHRRGGAAGARETRAAPPLQFRYAAPSIGRVMHRTPEGSIENVPQGLTGSQYQWTDLFGEGMPGILYETDRAWHYKRNLGGGRFADLERVAERPSHGRDRFTLSDFDRDGNPNLVVLNGRGSGHFELDRERRTWKPFTPFVHGPPAEAGARPQWVDLNGDGLPDLIINRQDRLTWYRSHGKDGFAAPVDLPLPATAAAAAVGGRFPGMVEDASLDQFLVDMTGDGLPDLVRVCNGCVEYWPNLGNGRFGERIVMGGAPRFVDFDSEFDAARLRFVDLSGNGATDLLYIGRGEVRCWFNGCGNQLIEAARIRGLPFIDNVSTVRVLDFLGDGAPSLVWSTPVASERRESIQYLKLADGPPVRLLTSVSNSIGGEVRLNWVSSAKHYCADAARGEPWLTSLPCHRSVVQSKEIIDHIASSRLVSRFEYHDGWFDSEERMFAGFCHVDRFDSETAAGPDGVSGAQHTPTLCVRTWLHNGTHGWESKASARSYRGDPDFAPVAHSFIAQTPGAGADALAKAQRALAGRVIREETFAVDAHGRRAEHPFEVTERSYLVRMEQPEHADQRGVLHVLQTEAVTHAYEQRPHDPRITHNASLLVDDFGNVLRDVHVAYPRRNGVAGTIPAQRLSEITSMTATFASVDVGDRFLHSVAFDSQDFELRLPAPEGRIYRFAELRAAVDAALANVLAFSQPLPPAGPPTARRTSWDRAFYWNDNRTATLPQGNLGSPLLLHHEETAVFDDAFIDLLFDGNVDAAMLQGQGRYKFDSGYWWQRDKTQHYLEPAKFALLDFEERDDGAVDRYRYDPHLLATMQVRDALGNTTTARIDYHLLQPDRVTDPNGFISELIVDPLGVAIVSTSRGSVLGPAGAVDYGFGAAANYQRVVPDDPSAVLADPASFIQNIARFVSYDLDAWRTSAAPCAVVKLSRENLVSFGTQADGGPDRVAAHVTYLGGFAQEIQARAFVDPGSAIQRDVSGVIVDAEGVPVLAPAANRWLVSGHTVLDSKGQPIQRYEPYFSNRPDYEDDEILREFGVSGRLYYDARGRMIREELPGGAMQRTEIDAWTIRTFDANDAVNESFYREQREGFPAGHPERLALEASQAHADTPAVTHLDAAGREAVVVEALEDGTAIEVSSSFDVDGNQVRIVDGRNLEAFVFDRDMEGRVLRVRSVDAGERRMLPDAFDRVIVEWNALDVERGTEFDFLDRPRVVRETHNGATRVAERFIYGEDGAVANAAMRHARGRLVQSFDQAGVLTVEQYTPDGSVMHSIRQIIDAYDAEPDWSNPPAVQLLPANFATRSEFDGEGRVIRQAPADGTMRRVVYQRGGGLDQIRLTTNDGALMDRSILGETQYNARGQRVRAVLGSTEITYRYDHETHRLVRLTAAPLGSANPAAAALQDIEYTYDAVGNVVRSLDHAQAPAHASPVLVGRSVSSESTYVYDALYRLKEAHGRVHQALQQHDYRDGINDPTALKGTRHLSFNNGSALERYRRLYSYDAAGNIKFIRHLGATSEWRTDIWTSPTSNRSLPTRGVNGLPIADPETWFDAGGNTRRLPHLRELQWSTRSNLERAVIIDRSAAGQPSDVEFYVNGGDGGRVRKVTERLQNGAVEVSEKIYLDGCEIHRVRRNNVTRLERVTSHISDGAGRIAMLHQWTVDTAGRETDDVAAKRIHLQLTNHLGSTTLEVDPDGKVISYEEYFPFGGTSFVAGDAVRVRLKDYRYTGQEHDDATGLYHFEYRYYAPWIGNWLSPDPIGPQDGLNLYEFVRNNPINLVDPSGLQATEAEPKRGEIRNVPVASAPSAMLDAVRRIQERGDLDQLGKTIFLHHNPDTGVVRELSFSELVDQIAQDLKKGNVNNFSGSDGSGDSALSAAISLAEFVNLLHSSPLSEDSEDAGEGPAGDPNGADGGDENATGADNSSADSKGTAGGHDTGTGNVNSADGKANTSADPGSGTANVDRGGTGAGEKDKAGTGGGGTSDEKGTGTGSGAGAGSGSAGRGTGAGAGVAGGVGSDGVVGGKTGGAEDGVIGGAGTGPAAQQSQNGDGVGTDGSNAVPGGEAHGQSPNGTPDGSPKPGASGNDQGTTTSSPAPAGRSDVNGSPDGSRYGTRGAAGGSEGRERAEGTDAEKDQGRAGPPPTTLDKLSKVAGYWHMEFGSDDAKGESGGIPGGMGLLNLNLGPIGQIAYLALTAIDIVLTVASFGSWAAIKTGIKGAFKLGVRLIRRAATAAAGALRKGARVVKNFAKNAIERGRNLARSVGQNRVFRRGAGGEVADAVTVKQVKIALGQAGMSVKKYAIKRATTEPANVHGFISRIEGKVVSDWRGRPIINITPTGLSSMNNAVATIGHEIRHIRDAMAGLTTLSEAAAEEFGQRFLAKFLRRSNR